MAHAHLELTLLPLRLRSRAGALLLALAAASGSLRAALPADIVAPSYQLSLAQDEAWRTLFQTLANQGGIHSQFEEFRFLPIRKTPIILTGEMRLSPEHGLSLHYLKPEESRVIIDSRGILLRDARGRSRDVGSDPRARGATGTLLQVLRFDLAVLERDFTLYGAREGIAWKVVLEPKPEAIAQDTSLGRIIIHGQEEAVLLIELRRSDRQRIEIHVGDTRIGVSFSPEELSAYFR